MPEPIVPAQSDRRHQTPEDLTARIAQLEEQVQRLSISPWFGCLTRNGLDEAIANLDLSGLSLVYFDIDQLRQANDRWGKPETSRRISEAIATRHGDVLIGQHFSGDEFIAFPMTADAYGYASRVQSQLREREMSATFVITPLQAGDSIGAVAKASDELITAYKCSGRRGIIVTMGEL